MTLKKLLDLYNFRNYRTDVEIDSKKYDTQTIRIYLDSEYAKSDRYVEFGVYDFSEDEYKEGIYTEFISAEALKREVEGIWYDEEIGIFCVWLGKNNDIRDK